MNRPKDRLGGMLLLAFFGSYAWLSQNIHLPPAYADAAFTAQTLPHFLAGLGILAAAWLVAFPPKLSEVVETRPTSQSLNWSRLLSFLALMSVYGLSLRPLGFLLSTSLFLMAGFLLLGERRPAWLLGVAVLVTVGFWALMSLGLGVFLSPWPALISSGV